MTDRRDVPDDLDDLRAAMRAATPAPDAARRAADLALAQKNFDALQGSRDALRPTSVRPAKGPVRGVFAMLSNLSLSARGLIGATTALVALGVVVTVIDPVMLSRDLSAPVVEPAARAEAVDAAVAETERAVTPPPAPALAEPMVQHSRAAPLPSVLPMPDVMVPQGADTEAFANAPENPLRVTATDPVSTFSIDVDTASYAFVRRALNAGHLPPRDAVRIEEMVNYFPYSHPLPDADGAPFRPTVSVVQTPWNADTRLVHIALQGRPPLTENRPPLNLVFLIDTSGSMQGPDRLGLLKQSLALMLPRLGARDQVAIVTYAGSAGQVLAPTPAAERATILAALEQLEAGGSTAGQAGLQQAYATAASMAAEGEVTRVILATDGDFNVGLSDPQALKDFVATQRAGGTYLSVLGFGRGNIDDAVMQALAQNGNGQAAYIDTLSEAQKVLVDQFAGAMFPIADDVKVQVEFNPASIAEYRLIGYETRALRREDFNNDRVDAGEIGAGHSITALYEVTPVGSPARLTDPLRYQAGQVAVGAGEELGFLRLRYKVPGSAESALIEQAIPSTVADAGDEVRFAAAIAGFGQLLTGAGYLGDWGWDAAIALASGARGDDPFGYRTEAVQLMRLAQSLSR